MARILTDGGDLDSPPGSPPLSHFPPLFALVLAGVAAPSGADPLDVAGVLNPLLFGAAAALVGHSVRRRAGSTGAGAVAAILAVTGIDLLVFGASALSEPLFSVLTLAAVLVLATAIRTGRTTLVVGAGGLAGAALLTRYAGVALVVAGCAVLWRRDDTHGGRRALLFGAIALAPVTAWLAYAGNQARTVAVHGFDAGFWATGLHTLSKWVLPPFLPWPLRAAAGAAGAALLGVVVVRRRRQGWSWLARPPRPAPTDPLPALLSAFAVAYTGLLVAGRLLLDASGRLDGRFLGPLHLVALVGLAPVVHRLMTAPRAPAVARRVAAGGAVLLALHGANAAVWVTRGLTDEGVERRGLTGRPWRDSAVVATVGSLPPSVRVFSNAPDAVFLLSGRRTERIPAHHDLLTGRANRDYPTELAAVGALVRRGEAVVAWFAPLAYRGRFLASPTDVGRAVPLTPVLTDDVGVLYRATPP